MLGKKIILGSQSKARREILKQMGYEFEIMPSDIDEKQIRLENPTELTLALARAKAAALLPKIKEAAILITSDQVVVWNRTIREKPENEAQAREYLGRAAEHPSETVTAMVVINTATGKQAEGVDVAKVYFSDIPEEIISRLIEEGNIFNQAGGFSIDDPLVKDFVRRIEGEHESIEGLPKKLTERLMEEVADKL